MQWSILKVREKIGEHSEKGIRLAGRKKRQWQKTVFRCLLLHHTKDWCKDWTQDKWLAFQNSKKYYVRTLSNLLRKKSSGKDNAMLLNFKRHLWLIGANKKYTPIDVGNMKTEDLLVKKNPRNVRKCTTIQKIPTKTGKEGVIACLVR